MKLTFESNLNYQQEAIKSINDLFEGQPLEDSILEFYLKEDGALNLINGVSNNLILSEEQILANLQDIQASNEIKVSGKLDGMHFSMIDGIKYQKIGGSEYEMTLFEAQELEVYLNDSSFKVSDPSKTIYEEFMPLDSGVESKFAQDCETTR